MLGPFTHLPFDVFRVGYGILELAVLAVSGLAYTLIIPGVVEDVVRGNIHVLLAMAIVAGFRLPAAWAAVLLTKVTPPRGGDRIGPTPTWASLHHRSWCDFQWRSPSSRGGHGRTGAGLFRSAPCSRCPSSGPRGLPCWLRCPRSGLLIVTRIKACDACEN